MKLAEFIIRQYMASDLSEVLNLWEHHSGWGRPEEKEYEKWLKTPFGDCIVLVAENVDNKKIIGQIYYTPTEIYVSGNKSKAVKISAPIIHDHYRSTSMLMNDSLMIRMVHEGNKIILDRGYEWIYNFPAPGWARIMNSFRKFGLNPWKVQTFSCHEVGENHPPDGKYELKLLNHFPDKVQAIWEGFMEDHKDVSYVTRDIGWLQYKWGNDLKIGILDHSGSLEGYAVVKPDTGLLLDFILNDADEIPDVLVQLKVLYEKETMERKKDTKTSLKFMPNSFFKTHLKELKTIPVNYQFVFGLSSLASESALQAVNLDKWYVFPND